jgi:CubicO group peptidase (beta-lactamase class C family)
LVKENEAVLYRGYGLANREMKVPVTTETGFDVCSYAKSFTIAAILELEDEGKLSISDSLAKFFDNVPPDKRGITLRQLLCFRSGLHEYHDTSGDFEQMTRSEAIELILAQELRFAPGTDAGYSNSGFSLLAAIVEDLSGTKYTEFVRTRFFEPLGMNHTGFYNDTRWTDRNTAVGYDARVFESNSPAHWPEITWACMGNGCLVSNPGDLGVWLEAVAEGKILSKKSREKMQGLCHSLMVVDCCGRLDATAESSDYGFTAASFVFPDQGGYILVSANSDRVPAPRVAEELASVAFGLPKMAR